MDKPCVNSDIRLEIRRSELWDILDFKYERNKENCMKKYARSSYFENINGHFDKFSKHGFKAYWQYI